MHVQKNVVQKFLESPAWQVTGVLVAILSLAITIVTFLLNLIMEYGEIANSITKNGWDEKIIGIWSIVVLTFKDAYFLVGLTTILLVFSSPLFAKLIGLEISIIKLRVLQKWALNFCLFSVALAATFQRTAAVLVLSIALIQVLNYVQTGCQHRDSNGGKVLFPSNLYTSRNRSLTYPKAERLADNYQSVIEDGLSQSISLQTFRPERTQPIPRPKERHIHSANSQKKKGA